MPALQIRNKYFLFACIRVDVHGKDCSYNPIAFPPSMEVRCTNAAGAWSAGATIFGKNQNVFSFDQNRCSC